jgi:hypothetical protein
MTPLRPFQTFAIIGLALGFILIFFGVVMNWVQDSKIDAWALGTLAFAFLLLCVLIRKRIARIPGA